MSKSTTTKPGYSIDFVSNTVTITRKFRDAASQLNTPEFNIMNQLREMNLTILVKAPNKKKSTALTYAKMQKFISCLDEADKYQRMFDAIRNESKGMPAPYKYVVSWFYNTFPKYGQMPEHDADMRIVNTPAEYQDVA